MQFPRSICDPITNAHIINCAPPFWNSVEIFPLNAALPVTFVYKLPSYMQMCMCKCTSKSLQKCFSCIKCNSNEMSCCSNSESCTLHWCCWRWWRREFCSVEKLVLVFVFSRCLRPYCCISRDCGPRHSYRCGLIVVALAVHAQDMRWCSQSSTGG